MLMQMDMVRPPLFWDIEGAHIEEYSHINLSIDRIDIHNAKGRARPLDYTSEINVNIFVVVAAFFSPRLF